MAKKVFPPAIIFNPTPVIMVSCQGNNGKPNIITVSWAGVLCSEPPMIGISIRPNRYSSSLIKESMEFALNFPSSSLIEKADYCGSISGKAADKFQDANLTPAPSKEIKAPIIKECPINVECRVKQIIPLGTHELFIGEVVAYHLDEDIIVKTNKADIEKADPVAYSPGTLEYRRLGEVIGTYGFTKGKMKEVGT
ncbi:MAG: flavin reductase family protein [Nitrospirae bacterium]|nr:flavin reductase family protein [Nitrospirota bacterium]